MTAEANKATRYTAVATKVSTAGRDVYGIRVFEPGKSLGQPWCLFLQAVQDEKDPSTVEIQGFLGKPCGRIAHAIQKCLLALGFERSIEWRYDADGTLRKVVHEPKPEREWEDG